MIPKQKKEHGLKPTDLHLGTKAIVKVIEDYTRESGVRNLERKIGSVCRNIAKSVAMEEEYDKTLTLQDISRILGTEDFDKEMYQGNDGASVVTGLAWTQSGR